MNYTDEKKERIRPLMNLTLPNKTMEGFYDRKKKWASSQNDGVISFSESTISIPQLECCPLLKVMDSGSKTPLYRPSFSHAAIWKNKKSKKPKKFLSPKFHFLSYQVDARSRRHLCMPFETLSRAACETPILLSSNPIPFNPSG